MTTPKRPSLTRAMPPPGGRPWVWLSDPPPRTTAQRLERIEALALRIRDHVQFISTVEELGGTSAEAKERAVAAFYERIAALERQLGLIHENLRLG